MRGRTAKQYRNYGELLYTEGLTKRENQMKLIAKKQKDDEAREMAEITGKPEIRSFHFFNPSTMQKWIKLAVFVSHLLPICIVSGMDIVRVKF